MTEPLTLAATDAIEVRDEATREFAIRLIPHGEVADRGEYTESISAGAHEGSDPTQVIIRDAHRRDALTDILGVGTAWDVRDDATWLIGTAAQTPEGDRALALARIGALRASAGFTEVPGGQTTEQRDGRRHVTRNRIRVVEAGLLTNPAYQSTQVIAREEEPSVTEPIATSTAPEVPVVAPVVAPAVEERGDNRPVLTSIAVVPRVISAAQFAVLHVRASHGDAVARAAITEMRDRDAARRIEERALAQETIADDIAAGALPPAVIGELTGRAIRKTPLLGVYRRLPMPELGMTLSRPKVTQHFLVGYQTAEKTELPGRDVKIGADTVTIHTFGGALNVSRQFIDRTPYWGRVFEDMVTTWANAVNAELGGAGNGTTAIKGLQSFAIGVPVHGTGATLDGGSLSTAVYGAWTDMVNGPLLTGPDVAVMNSTTWAKVASMVDANKRPLFPSLAPSNASGTASLDSVGGFYGLPVVLDSTVPADVIYLVNGDALEAYIAPSGDQPFTLSVDEPGILGVETAIYSYISTYAQPGGIGVVKLGATVIPLMVEPQSAEKSSKASKEAA